MGFIWNKWTIGVLLLLVLVRREPRAWVFEWLKLAGYALMDQLRKDGAIGSDEIRWGRELSEAVIATVGSFSGVVWVDKDWVVDVPEPVYRMLQDPESRARVVGQLVEDVNGVGHREAYRTKGKWTDLVPSDLGLQFVSTGPGLTVTNASAPVLANTVPEPAPPPQPEPVRPRRASREPDGEAVPRIPPTREKKKADLGFENLDPVKGSSGVATREMSVMADLWVNETCVASACVMRGRGILIGRDPRADLRVPADLDLVSAIHGEVSGGMRGRAVFTDRSTNGTWFTNVLAPNRAAEPAVRVEQTQFITPGSVIVLGGPAARIRVEFR